MQKTLIILLNIIFLFITCNPVQPVLEEPDLTKGVFIINEGNFTANNGEISFYNTETKELINNLYSSRNEGKALGDVVQSFGFNDDYGFIVVNNSKKIEVVSLKTFKQQTTITGIDYPRYWLTVSPKKGYITNGINPGVVYVVNTETFEISDTIIVGKQPENMLLYNEKVFVANGAWGHDNTVSTIDTQTDKLIETVTVADGATDLIVDKNGDIRVLCQGKVTYDENWNIIDETESKIVTLDSENFLIKSEIIIGQTGDNFNPARLATNSTGEILYFIEKEGIYSINVNSEPESNLIISGDFYGLDINPENGNIYIFSSEGFAGAGKMFIYDKNTFNLITEKTVGIGPNGAVFKQD